MQISVFISFKLGKNYIFTFVYNNELHKKTITLFKTLLMTMIVISSLLKFRLQKDYYVKSYKASNNIMYLKKSNRDSEVSEISVLKFKKIINFVFKLFKLQFI